ncbi:pro-FMRFamide-related neuropeptide VF [Spea bombifrons]|uniref:pro-FMRFamide-related neuropeptide VF n=1 Tax=Spea bombifrons TaxID=233779 RepID=UPI002349369D|nr:pro-FMRFamide-related neuropeptide VF [Spea bombifrons]
MEMFSASKTILFILGTIAIFSSSYLCVDEFTTNLESQEKYDDLFEQSSEDVLNQRNGNSEELQYWGTDGVNEIASVLSKYSNLPIEVERGFLEERGIKPAVNLPQRFGRGSDDKVAKSVPNLPQRFGRYLPGKPSIQSAANLPQRFGRSVHSGHLVQSLAALPLRFGRGTHLQRLQCETNPYTQEIKNSQEGNDRTQGLNCDYERKLQM